MRVVSDGLGSPVTGVKGIGYKLGVSSVISFVVVVVGGGGGGDGVSCKLSLEVCRQTNEKRGATNYN